MPSNRLGPRIARKRLITPCELHRDPDTTPLAPHANRDAWGLPVKSNPPSGAQTGARKVADYKVELAQADAERAHVGNQTTVAAKVDLVAPWQVSFFGDGSAEWPAVDVRLGDQLKITGRFYKVIDPGGTGTHGILQIVRCQLVN